MARKCTQDPFVRVAAQRGPGGGIHPSKSQGKKKGSNPEDGGGARFGHRAGRTGPEDGRGWYETIPQNFGGPCHVIWVCFDWHESDRGGTGRPGPTRVGLGPQDAGRVRGWYETTPQNFGMMRRRLGVF